MSPFSRIGWFTLVILANTSVQAHGDTTPDGVWTWLPIDGALCGNGTPTGIGVSRVADSNTLLVFFEGGGACYDAETCTRTTTTSYIQSGYTQKTFETSPVERHALEHNWFLTSRTDAQNPFGHVNMAYVPYCTGDLHGGDNVITYPGNTAPTFHVGFRNTQLYFDQLAAQMPAVNNVWLSGFSAGGFGAALHRNTAADAFPQARIGVLDDSGLAFAGVSQHPSWNIHLPEECPECANDFSHLMDYYAANFPEGRYAFLSYTVDAILPLFTNQSPLHVAQAIADFAARVDSTPNIKYFYIAGDDHVIMKNPLQISGGVAFKTWITQMVNDDPAWQSHRP